MAVGDSALLSYGSYIGVGREITYGTYVTGTAGLNFLSCSLKTTQEFKILEEVQNQRVNSNGIRLGKVIEGDIEFYFSPRNVASNYLIQNAFGGGPVTTVTATGETIGGAAMMHQIDLSDFRTTYSSLSINMRKGDSVGSKVFEYRGLRINEFSLKAELDEPLICSVSLVGKDSSLSTNSIAAQLDTLTSVQAPLSFVSGRFSVENSTASLTSSTGWPVQSFEFKLNNNLKTDKDSRCIGSDTLQILPAGMATFDLNATIRFDTSTAFAAMIANTRLVAEFEFLGDTMSGSAIRESIKVTFPNVKINDSGDPEIGGPDEILSSQISFTVLRDPTASGYAVRALVKNSTQTYV